VSAPPPVQLQPPPPASPPTPAAVGDEGSLFGAKEGARWRRQINTWDAVVKRFRIDPKRYDDFAYLCFMNLEDSYTKNYVNFHLSLANPEMEGRLRAHLGFWETLHTPQWLLDIIRWGVKIPFSTEPPRIVLPNNKSAVVAGAAGWVRDTLTEYLQYGFVKKVKEIPYCVSPLQLKNTSGKMALIYDMSLLNTYIEKGKFKLEGWEEMFEYSREAVCGIKFDLKKFYHEIDIHEDHQQFFGFMYPMSDGGEPTYFVWKTLPYGYTRAPFIAREIMKPLIKRWRSLGALVVVFYDDGMLVNKDPVHLKKMAIEVQCDLLNAGLVPGVQKCVWRPTEVIDWNGLRFDFASGGISILEKRIVSALEQLQLLTSHWPSVTYRDIAKCVGRLGSMYPVFGGIVQIRTKMLQTFINIRNYKNSLWEDVIFAEYLPLFDEALSELRFWNSHLRLHNFRRFKEPKPDCIAWVDASDYAIGGIAAQLTSNRGVQNIVTVDNWLLTIEGALRKIHSGVPLHTDGFPWQGRPSITVRDGSDLDPAIVEKLFVVHRNLNWAERALDSNERELLAASQLLRSCAVYWENSRVTIYFDNMNAAGVCEKGSSKPRLQKYAKLFSDIALAHNLVLKPIWIPRDLNNMADYLSKSVDYDDHAVNPEFFNQVCEVIGIRPAVDRFADDRNCKTAKFFSAVFCPGTAGVDAFNYPWELDGVNWIFPPLRLLGRALYHLKRCSAAGVFLFPQWRNSYYYPLFNLERGEKSFLGCWVFSGQNIFIQGSDPTSYFGPAFRGNVEVWVLDFRK
jgi:hypothetical protein